MIISLFDMNKQFVRHKFRQRTGPSYTQFHFTHFFIKNK